VEGHPVTDDAGREPGAGPDPWADRLRILAPFATAVRAPDFAFGAWQAATQLASGAWTMPYHELADDGRALIAACGAWIQVGFDWSRWAQTDEAKRLFEDPSAVRDATPQQIAWILTLLIRAERFSEGQLDWAWRSGLFERLLDRVAELHAVARER
jgi:hypothetical protein